MATMLRNPFWGIGICLWLAIQFPMVLVAEDIHTAILNELERTAKSIRKSNDEVFIGIGRSPTPIIAVMQLDNPQSAFNLPLSFFRHLPIERQPDGGAKYPWQSPLTESEREKLFSHFDTFIPTEKQLAGKNLVLLDYSTAGHSLIASYFYLEEYLRARGRKHEIRIVVLAEEEKSDVVSKRIKQFGIEAELYTLRGDHLPPALKDQGFDEFSEYPQFKILEHESPKRKPSAKYLKLLKDIKTERKEREISLRKAEKFERETANMSIRPPPNPVGVWLSKLGCFSILDKVKKSLF